MKITKVQQKQLNKIGKKYQLELMVLHGSKVKGKTHAMSDFDVGVLRRIDLKMSEYVDLLSDLCKFFKVRKDKIDIKDLGDSPASYSKDVADRGTVLYEKNPQSFAEFYLGAYKEYIDYCYFMKKVAHQL